MNEDRNRTLDFIKGIFIIFVIALHFPFSGDVAHRFLFPFWVEFAVPGFLFISGYVYALSYEKKAFSKLEDMYAPKDLLIKCLRFIIPFTIVFIAEQILFRVFGIYTVGIVEYGLRALFFDYLRGGIGMGSYYFPLMIQFIFIFPLIYAYVKRKGIKAVINIFIINIAYEVLKLAFGMSESEYRLLICRYLFIIAFGCYACIGKKEEQGRLYRGFIEGIFALGVFFVLLFSYTSYEPKLFTFWSTTSAPTTLYIAPIMFIIVKMLKVKFSPLELVGKASFDVFLVQMVYFVLYENCFRYGYFANINELLSFVITVAICVVLGILLWLLESKLIFKTIKRRILS